jgi:hypothetical protein
MPVIIAAVVWQTKCRLIPLKSARAWAPLFIINGPVRKDAHINCGSGALSPGNIANSAIGRAVGLIVKNIGGARKAIEDMGTLGNPGKYALVLGENEEESPWQPYSVDLGYKREDNTVTVLFPNRYTMTIPAQTNAEGIATSLAGMGPRSLSALIVIPDHARIFSAEGWTKQQVKDFIIKKNSAPAQNAGGASVPLKNEDFMIVVAGGPGVWLAAKRRRL